MSIDHNDWSVLSITSPASYVNHKYFVGHLDNDSIPEDSSSVSQTMVTHDLADCFSNLVTSKVAETPMETETSKGAEFNPLLSSVVPVIKNYDNYERALLK